MIFVLSFLISMLTVTIVCITNATQEDVFNTTGDFHMISDLTTDATSESPANDDDDPVIPYSIKILIIFFSAVGVIANGFAIFVFIKSI